MVLERCPYLKRIDKCRPDTINDRGRILTFRVKGSGQWNVYDYFGLNQQAKFTEQKGEKNERIWTSDK